LLIPILACLFVSSKFCGELFLSECGLLWHISLEAHPTHKRGLVKERTISWSGLSTFFWPFTTSFPLLYFC